MGGHGRPGRLALVGDRPSADQQGQAGGALRGRVQALDSVRLAEALERRLQAEGRALDVYAGQYFGRGQQVRPASDEAAAFIRQLPSYGALRVRGLMTLAVLSADAARVRQCFVLLRTLRDRLRQEAPAGVSLDELSMGMSGDYEIAIEEGATVVRVGQAIYGARALPNDYYWPDSGAADRAEDE